MYTSDPESPCCSRRPSVGVAPCSTSKARQVRPSPRSIGTPGVMWVMRKSSRGNTFRRPALGRLGHVQRQPPQLCQLVQPEHVIVMAVGEHHGLGHDLGPAQLRVGVGAGVHQHPPLDQDRRSQPRVAGILRVHCGHEQPSRGIGQAAAVPRNSTIIRAAYRRASPAAASSVGCIDGGRRPSRSRFELFRSRRRVVSALVRRAHPRPAAGLAGDRRRQAHADPCSDRIGQDAGGVPVGDRRAHPAPRASGTRVLYVSPLKALNHDIEKNLRAPLAGIASDRDITVGGAHRRHAAARARGDAPPPARHPDHHARVALPDADLGGPRDAGRTSRR